MTSGIGGYLTSCIFDPDTVGVKYVSHNELWLSMLQVGPAGALYGLLGVQLVELLQSWRLIDRPWLELIKLLINIVLLLGKITYDYYTKLSFVYSLRAFPIHR